MDSVVERYAAAAHEREEALCCPVSYDPKFLKVIPPEVLDRDYGCGDPSTYVREGEIVLDLGAGGGKICFIAAQIVGPKGRVIGVDMNDDMLALSRSAQDAVTKAIGYDNVEFRHGCIQDLKTDLDAVSHLLDGNPVKNATDYKALESAMERLREERPLVESDSIDVVVSNCVLNLVADHEKPTLFAEIFRVLKPGGRIAISDIVSDRETPQHLKANGELWSGCISGALTESGFADALVDAGFIGVSLDKLEQAPWQVVEEIEYRSATYLAYKPDTSCGAQAQLEAVYAGPWEQVVDEAGRIYRRGERVQLSGDDASALRSGAFSSQFVIFGEPEKGCC